MIDVTYNRSNHKLIVTGHAKSGEAGHDLVCAAASILVYTLAEDVIRLSMDKRHIRRPSISIADGNASITCFPIHGMSAVITMIFDSVCSGFSILAEKYPENINYKTEG